MGVIDSNMQSRQGHARYKMSGYIFSSCEPMVPKYKIDRVRTCHEFNKDKDFTNKK